MTEEEIMDKKLTFFEALEIVEVTNRRICCPGYPWSLYRHERDDSIACLIPIAGKVWWPNIAQQKERIWEVEPAENVKKIACVNVDFTPQIISEICEAVRLLGGDMVVTALIGSFRDTLPDDEILEGLKEWNQNFNKVNKNEN